LCRSLCPAGRRVLIVVGTGSDRSDELIRSLGELATRNADRMVVCETERNLRLRNWGEMTMLFRTGAQAVGVTDVPAHRGELAALRAVVAEAGRGDVCAVMCHAEREEVFAWLETCGATSSIPVATSGRPSRLPSLLGN
jgi:cyanophycin synthetase